MDYMGDSDETRRDWLQNFATRTSAQPGVYMLSAADVAAIVSNVAVYAAALTTARTVETRNAGTIAVKTT